MTVVEQARRPAFYARLGVPDSLDGRFDMIVLHAALLVRRLRGEGADGTRLAQALFDEMFADMDRSLREMGVGDLGVGKRVKSMAKAFYGRAAAYEKGLVSEDGSLAAALRRNLYGTVEATPPPEVLAAMTAYVRRQAAALESQPAAGILAGSVQFDDPPAVAGEG